MWVTFIVNYMSEIELNYLYVNKKDWCEADEGDDFDLLDSLTWLQNKEKIVC